MEILQNGDTKKERISFAKRKIFPSICISIALIRRLDMEKLYTDRKP